MDFLPLLLAKACAVKAIWAAADVRFGSKADIGAGPRHVRFTPNSGHWNWPVSPSALVTPAISHVRRGSPTQEYPL